MDKQYVATEKQSVAMKPFIMSQGLKVPGAQPRRHRRIMKTAFAIQGISKFPGAAGTNIGTFH
jgi:hypothetical protein